MTTSKSPYLFAACLSVALHALVLSLVGLDGFGPTRESEPTKPETHVVFLAVESPPPQDTAAAPPPPSLGPTPGPAAKPRPVMVAPEAAALQPPVTERPLAFREAPPAPTSQEWALAAGYALKNSKRYRHTWGQQVRSMMGTAFEGRDQGVVRFRIEIAPDGTLVRLETLWSTSAKAEELARQAVAQMPPLPPTPTGKPLIFEKTIAFQPFAEDDTPVYKDDCLPDRPGFRNPYVSDGQPGQPHAVPQPVEDKSDPLTLEECLKQLPQDSFEGESAHDQRQLRQWRSDKLGR